jgi:hypothetical protein
MPFVCNGRVEVLSICFRHASVAAGLAPFLDGIPVIGQVRVGLRGSVEVSLQPRKPEELRQMDCGDKRNVTMVAISCVVVMRCSKGMRASIRRR